MYHISDVKKFDRCPRLFLLSQRQEKVPTERFLRLDEQFTALAIEKLKLDTYFLGEKGDHPDRALQALQTYDWLVKARFEYQNLRVKVPFLHKVEGGYDLYFLYTSIFPHNDDMTFYQAIDWVLKNNGIQIQNYYLIHLNHDYVREDELDIDQLFTISTHFYSDRNLPNILIKDAIDKKPFDFTTTLSLMEQTTSLPEAIRSNRCFGRTKCTFYQECFKDEPVEDNSILYLLGAKERFAMYQEGKKLLMDADLDRIEGSRPQFAQILAGRNRGLYFDRLGLSAWLSQVTYPITFIDFEWELFALPPYPKTRPFQVIPFEYSIHVLHEDGTITHKVFLDKHDTRRSFVEHLIQDVCPTGSLIAYNATGAEIVRLQELMEYLPEYQKELQSMIDRMLDLQVPFSTGAVYDIRMKGSYSLKNIISFLDEEGYSSLAIQQGMEAVYQWRKLDRDSQENTEEIIESLKAYCGMDTYAMIIVYRWLKSLCQD